MLSAGRLSAALLAALVIGCLSAGSPALADGTDPVDCSRNPSDPRCTVRADRPGESDRAGRRAPDSGPGACRNGWGQVVPCSLPGVGVLADDGCYYSLAAGEELRSAVAFGGPVVPPGQWYVGRCGYPPVPGLTKYRVFAGGVVPDPAVLAAEAVRDLRLPLPGIRVNPSPPAAQLVFLPTWLWLDAASWGPRAATASVPGLSVTATARPSRLVFSAGDGVSVSCVGRGTPWTQGTDPEAGSPTCGHTYTRRGVFTLTATVTWEVSWAGGGRAGTVPDLVTTAAVQVRVVESQALNADAGR